jgi:hypothetical protein
VHLGLVAQSSVAQGPRPVKPNRLDRLLIRPGGERQSMLGTSLAHITGTTFDDRIPESISDRGR